MKISIDLDPESNPNILGEILREIFFDHSKGYGCYSTFDLTKDVEKMPNYVHNNDGDEEVWTCAKHKKLGIEMRWYWDGDGTLMFIFNDGSVIINTDCKKDYNWEYWEKYSLYFEQV